jgi:hypothetical protein
MTWDTNICLNYEPKKFYPFKYFARPVVPTPTKALTTFTRFAELPAELHLQIYDFCDAPTLFQLMHTCSSTRSEALKRFWVDRSVWYSCTDGSLFSHDNHHSIVLHCSLFASQIRQVEIDLVRVEFVFAGDEEPTAGEGRQMTTAQKAAIFWERVQKIFPAIERVVLTGAQPRRAFPPIGHDDHDDDYSTIERAVEQAPPNIEVFVALQLVFNPTIQQARNHALWRISPNLNPSWQLVEQNWQPQRVLLPPRQFTSYPLGALLKILSQQSLLILERRGLAWLVIESYARYAKVSGIECPGPECSALFHDRNDWERHMYTTHHHRPTTEELECCKDTPTDVCATIARRHEQISIRAREMEDTRLKLQDDWGGAGSEKRRAFEEAFYAQLREENFFKPGELLEEVCSWIDALHSRVDPTHVYY